MNKYGVIIENAPLDWQIIQHKNGEANIIISGTWTLNKINDMEVIEPPCVRVRALQEDDNMPLCPWQSAQTLYNDNGDSGKWSYALRLPAGGLYRIETALYTNFGSDKQWLERGDVRFHIGVGNVFVIAGQSNAAGVGRDSAWDPPSLGVHHFRNCKRWDMAAHPLNESTNATDDPNAENGVTGTSPYLSFARMFKKMSGYPVGLISTASGGSGINSWVNNISGELYRNMLQKIELCGGNIAGVLWYQGCRDTLLLEEAMSYQTKFAQMVSDLRKELSQMVPFFTFQLNGSPNNPNALQWPIIKEAQRKSALALANVYILPTSDSTFCDLIHNSSRGNVSLGERLARQCASILCGGVEWLAPDILSAKLSNDILRLTFTNKSSFIGFNHSPGTGFTVEDSSGKISVISWTFAVSTIDLQLAIKPTGSVLVSFEEGCQPSKNPVCDSETYLPIISFNKFSCE